MISNDFPNNFGKPEKRRNSLSFIIKKIRFCLRKKKKILRGVVAKIAEVFS